MNENAVDSDRMTVVQQMLNERHTAKGKFPVILEKEVEAWNARKRADKKHLFE